MFSKFKKSALVFCISCFCLNYNISVSAISPSKLDIVADDLNNKIIGLTEDMEIKIGDKSWVKYSKDINLDLSGNKKVLVRYKNDNLNNYEEKEFLFTSISVDAPMINFAGNGKNSFKDGSREISEFNFPYSITLDKDGGIIVVDSYNNRIRKITDNKVITLAGFTDKNDIYGFPMAGYKDGEALTAKFNKPRDAVVDSKGNIFVTDTGNNAIRKISNNIVYTFAGNGEAGYADGYGKKAKFNLPSGITIDKEDNLYVADSLNNVVRKITPSGEVSTYAGVQREIGGYADGEIGSARFNEPSDLSIDKNGVLYVTDSGNQIIRKIYNGKVTTISGEIGEKVSDTDYIEGDFKDGTALEAKYNFPKGIAITDEGVLLIADTWNNKVRAIKPDGTVCTIAGGNISIDNNQQLDTLTLSSPTSVLYNKGYVYICDSWNNSIRVMPLYNNKGKDYFHLLSNNSSVQSVAADKEWKINFNKEIDKDCVKDRIIVYNKSKMKEVSITPIVLENNKSIIIKHNEKFTVGDEYIIYISNIEGKNEGESLGHPIMFEFTVS